MLVREQLRMQTQALLPPSLSKGPLVTAFLTVKLTLNPLGIKKTDTGWV